MRFAVGGIAVALLLAVAVAGMTACGGNGHGAIVAEAAQQSAPVVRRTRIVGALPAEQRVLRQLLRELGPTRIQRVGIKPLHRPGRYDLPPDAVTITIGAGSSLRGHWEAVLVAGRYRTEARNLGLRTPGRLRVGDGGSGIRPLRREYRPARLESLRRVLRQSDAHLIELARPLGAIAVTIRSPDPAAFLKRYGRELMRALGETRTSANRYWALQDEDGTIVYAWGAAAFAGMTYARADLYACGPIITSGTIGETRPACPA
jgi:hypothetical protein